MTQDCSDVMAAGIVEGIDERCTYPKAVIVSYLTRKAVADCYRAESGGRLIPCEELTELVEFFGLIPLGPAGKVRFHGRNVIESELRRATGVFVKNAHKRVTRSELRRRARSQ